MNRIKDFVLFAFLAVVGVAFLAYADSGREAATRLERGSYGGSWAKSVASGSSTQIWGSSPNRPDITCMNNTAGALYLMPLSTMTYTQSFIVMASATFSNDAFTGIIFGSCDTGKTCDVRCWSGNVY